MTTKQTKKTKNQKLTPQEKERPLKFIRKSLETVRQGPLKVLSRL